ncbi:MAG TPA: protein kinase [Bryobacteraceae bacterium]|nr:protein kinase [Bryobacteraceae bacterium]
MNPERWGQIERLYHAALEREPKGRGKFLAEACERDTELRGELESLLAYGGTSETFLEKPAFEFAAPLLVDDHALHGSEDVRPNPRPPWWMYLIAASFLAHVVFITAFWLVGPESMGIDVRLNKTYPVVSRVAPDSPADKAGIRPGDVLVRANGQLIRDVNYWYWFFTNVETGRPITFEADRGGEHVRAVLLLRRRPVQYWSTSSGIIGLLNLCGRFIAFAVACLMAFLRPRHLLACIGALFLAIMSTAELVLYDGLNSMWRHSPLWFQLLLWFANVLVGLGWGVCFAFFALFPRPSFHSRWVWTLVWTPPVVASLLVNYQIWHLIYSPEHMIPSSLMAPVLAPCLVAYVLASFVMLAIKYRRLEGKTEKRRVRLFVASLAFVIVLGLPVLVYSQADFLASPGAALFLSVPMRALATLAGVAFPLCFAYAILRHRLFDIRVIIRQGIRYAAAKQLLLLAAPAIIAVFLADIYTHRDRRVDEIVQERGWIYAGLAGLAVLAHLRRERWLRSLDRHFFREQYNAQDILHSTLEQVRGATNLADVAPAVVKQIYAAVHPSFCAVLERRPMDTAYSVVSIFPDRFSPPVLRVQSKVIEVAKLVAKPFRLSTQDGWLSRELPAADVESLASSGVDLLAPVHASGLDAFIALGKKRSEEPYTSDDVRLIEDLSIGLALLPSRSVVDPADASSKECPVCAQCYDLTDELCRRDGSRLATNSFPRCFLGRFRLEFRIGRGGMGLVYEATDMQLQRKIAVKLILEDSIKDPAALDRFRREAHVLASFQHSHVVTLFDAGVASGGQPFLVMERLVGRTLREELNARTRLPAIEVRSMVRQLCAALSSAHRRSLIHRDLKPENIFLCDDDTQRLVKILDFGLAKLLIETSSLTQSTSFSTFAGQIVGTPAYMAPELQLGAKPERGCDIWSLAIITYEMLTGQRPLFARDGGLIDSSAEGLPGYWSGFFNWSLAREPSQRPESVDVFLDRFEQSAANVLAPRSS